MKKYLQYVIVAGVFASASFSAVADSWQSIPVSAGREYLPDSVLRISDHVHLQTRGTLAGGNGTSEIKYDAPMEFDCLQKKTRAAYANTVANNLSSTRIYGSLIARYAPSAFVSVAGQKDGEALLSWACGLPPKNERLVNVARGSKDELFQIDLHSIVRSGTTVAVWARTEYPQMNFDPPYNAPFDSKREFVQMDCASNKYKSTIGYDFTPENAVTDGMIKLDDALTPIAADDEYGQALRAVCGQKFDPETYSGIGGDIARRKALQPIILSIDSVEVPPAVMETASKLIRIVPSKRTTSTVTLVQSFTSKSASSPSKIVLVIKPQNDGVTHLREIYSPEFYVDREMAGGIVQLKSKLNSTRAEVGGVYVTEKFDLKPFIWNADAVFSYSTSSHEVPGSAKPQETIRTCHVGSMIEASSLHPQLAGNAWSLACVDKDGFKHQGLYIEQLQFVFNTLDESKDYGVSTSKIDSVKIEP